MYRKAKFVLLSLLIISTAVFMILGKGNNILDALHLKKSLAQTNMEPFSHLQLAGDFKTSQVSLPPNAVSIAEVNESQFLTCTYTTIYLISLTKGSNNIEALNAPADIPIWNPTGLFFDKSQQLLYVANYKGKDVLVMKYNPQNHNLTLQQRITNESMFGPENVFVDSVGNIIVADYDGSSVLKFDKKGSLLWRVNVGQAHGVTEAGGMIYATSLTERAVLQIDQNGNILNKQGSLGVEVGQYLWPVCVAAIEDGQLAVLDAHTGRITILSQDLDVKSVFGGNGPGVDLFNYPYTLLKISDGYMITDTMKERLVKMSHNWNIDSQIVGQRIPSGTNLPIIHGLKKSPYTFFSMPAEDILNYLGISEDAKPQSFYGGFNSLDLSDANGKINHEIEIDDPKTPYFIGKSYWYVTWAKKIDVPGWGGVILIGSPQQSTAIVLDKKTGAWDNISISIDTWLVDDKLISSDNSSMDLNELVLPSIAKFEKLLELTEKGIDRSEALRRVFYSNESEAKFEEDFWKTILSSSTEGKEFYQSVSNNKDIQSAAVQYYTKVLSSYYIYLRELLAVKYLAGPDFKFRNISSFITISSNNIFYPGHEMNLALNNHGDNYAAAVEGQDEYGFEVRLNDSNLDIYSLKFAWLDDNNMPLDYDVVFMDKDNNIVQKNSIKDNVQKENYVYLEGKRPIATIRITFHKFSGQQRLILKKLDIYGCYSQIDENQIKDIAMEVSNKLEYSAKPLKKYGESLEDDILKNGYGHCGDYAYLMASKIKAMDGKIKVWDIKKNNGIIHTLVEVYDDKDKQWLTVDPTIGIVYGGDLLELLNNPDKAVVEVPESKAKQFKGYYGPKFFVGDTYALFKYTSTELEKAIESSLVN